MSEIKNTIQRIAKVSIRDEVIKQIRNMIQSGEYAVGERLPSETALQKLFGVGRSSIREAFQILQSIGLIDIQSGRGAFVKDIVDNTYETVKKWFIEREAELNEIMELRMAVESLAIKLAIQRGSSEQIEQINKIHKAFKEGFEKKLEGIDLARLDGAFHEAIVEASGNSLMMKTERLISDAFLAYRTRSFLTSEGVLNAITTHERIMEVLLRKDADSAVQEIQKQMEDSLEHVRRIVRE